MYINHHAEISFLINLTELGIRFSALVILNRIEFNENQSPRLT
jgi:hypothetical protein